MPRWFDVHAHIDRLEHSPEEAIRLIENAEDFPADYVKFAAL